MISITKEYEAIDLREGGVTSVFTVVKWFNIELFRFDSIYVVNTIIHKLK